MIFFLYFFKREPLYITSTGF